MLVLPASSTLHSYTRFAEAKSGIHTEIIKEMVKEMDLSQDFKRNVCVLFDEMKLKSGLVFSSTGRLMGFVDVGDIYRELRVFEEGVDGAMEPPLASHAFMIMARGIFSSTQQAMAFYPSSMLRSSDGTQERESVGGCGDALPPEDFVREKHPRADGWDSTE